jgi:uncharacterized protein DUF4389
VTTLPIQPRRHPVRLVVADDLQRSRLTVCFRLLLAVPHLVWVTLFGIAASFVALAAWLAVLIERRVPTSLHDFLARYVRYTTHLAAYLSFAGSPYPSFGGRRAYPVDVEVDPPAPQGRLGALFRLVLAVPASLVAWSLGGSAVLGLWLGFAALTILGGLTSTIAVLAWFACLAQGRMPRGMRDAAAYGCGYAAQVTAYALMVTGRYPDSSPDRLAPEAELPPHPVAVDVRDDLGRPRLLVLFRLPLVVPHLMWLTLWSVLVTAAVLIGWPAALVLGRLPRFIHRFVAAFVRTTAHVTAFLYVIGRPFPGFVGREGSYPVDVTIAPPARQRRVGVLLRLVLAVPALLLSYAYGWALLLVAVLAWLMALVVGRVPEGLRDLGVASLRYQTQITAYVLLLTSRYPDSSPVLVGRPEPPPGPEAVA